MNVGVTSNGYFHTTYFMYKNKKFQFLQESPLHLKSKAIYNSCAKIKS